MTVLKVLLVRWVSAEPRLVRRRRHREWGTSLTQRLTKDNKRRGSGDFNKVLVWKCLHGASETHSPLIKGLEKNTGVPPGPSEPLAVSSLPADIFHTAGIGYFCSSWPAARERRSKSDWVLGAHLVSLELQAVMSFPLAKKTATIHASTQAGLLARQETGWLASGSESQPIRAGVGQGVGLGLVRQVWTTQPL